MVQEADFTKLLSNQIYVLQYAFRDRKNRKEISDHSGSHINAATRELNVSYSVFQNFSQKEYIT